MALSSPLPTGLNIGQGPGRRGAVRPRSCQRGRGAKKACVVSTLTNVTPSGDKGQQHVCPPHQLCLISSAAESPLQAPAESVTRSKAFARDPSGPFLRGMSSAEVPPAAVVLPNAWACEWLNRHPLSLVPWGFYFNHTLWFALPY